MQTEIHCTELYRQGSLGKQPIERYKKTDGKRLICFKELVHVIETGKSKIFKPGQQAGDPEEEIFQLKSEGSLRAELFSSGEVFIFL